MSFLFSLLMHRKCKENSMEIIKTDVRVRRTYEPYLPENITFSLLNKMMADRCLKEENSAASFSFIQSFLLPGALSTSQIFIFSSNPNYLLFFHLRTEYIWVQTHGRYGDKLHFYGVQPHSDGFVHSVKLFRLFL